MLNILSIKYYQRFIILIFLFFESNLAKHAVQTKQPNLVESEINCVAQEFVRQ